MFDETDFLRDDARLFALLAHYATLGAEEREPWRDRVMVLDGSADDLTRLHGTLIAFDWLEQNTGATPGLRDGLVASCYRVTPAGLRAFKQARTEQQRPAA